MNRPLKNVVLTTVAILVSYSGVVAQFKSATIGVDGLTCSMCSLSVEKSIRKLPFVKDVIIDLNTTVAVVEFSDASGVEMRKLIKSVRDAGFSVRDLSASFIWQGRKSFDGAKFIYEDNMYLILNEPKEVDQDAIINVTFLDRTFTQSNLYKQYADKLKKFESQNVINGSYYFVVL
ncbi:heavy metal-associated domain-containing protein [Chryseolinea sp. T2]|uniref:heavy-metal-associated domain-containing protein n=1 Tax=Chryseolinea sp. T2 TaxID=3129255 RepID=UPI003078A450